MRNFYKEIMEKRFSCKLFDKNRKVSREDLEYILEVGILSPSSIGLEQWKFLVVESEDKKEKLQKACWDQPQISSATYVVVILGKIKELDPDGEYVKERLYALREKNSEVLEGSINFYKEYYKKLDIPRWSSEQCHIAGANILNAAQAIGVDSCPIGGFVESDVKEVLGIGEEYIVSFIIPLGYCAKKGREKDRLPFDKIVEFV